MLFSFMEVVDVAIMVLVVGYIFKDFLSPSKLLHDPQDFMRDTRKEDFWFSAGVVGIAIILHELGHKFVAMAFGLQATFHAAYTWLGIGLLLKILNTGFIFFVPAFVSITGDASHISLATSAFAGPGVNVLLWGTSYLLEKQVSNKKSDRKKKLFFFLSARINMFLFILNMLPIPGFDGFSVYSNLWKIFF